MQQQTINLAALASTFQAFKNCVSSNNIEWKDKHEDAINEILKALPSGSGIDSGVQFDWDRSTADKLIFSFGFHHMDDNGFYCGWTDHRLTVTPNFQAGYKIKISGQNKRDIKEYLYQLFHEIFYSEPYEDQKRKQRNENLQAAFKAGSETIFEDIEQTVRCAKYDTYEDWQKTIAG